MARSTFGKAARWLVLMLATLALTAILMKGFGLLQYVPGVGEFVYATANSLAIYGDEGVEDFYFEVTGIASLLLALGIVALAHRRWRRRVSGRTDEVGGSR